MVRSNEKREEKERDRKKKREKERKKIKEKKTFYILQSTFCRQPSIALGPPSGDRL